MQRIVIKAKEVVGGDASSLLLWDERSKQYKIRVSYELSPEYVRVVGLSEEDRVIKRIKTSPGPVEIHDVPGHFKKMGDKSSLEQVRREGIKSVISIPIMLDNRLIGTLHVYYRRKHRFSNEERELLKIFARLSAIAIENAAFIHERELELERLKVIHRIGLKLSKVRDFRRVLRSVYEEVKRVIPTKNFYIALYNPKKKEISFDIQVEEGKGTRGRRKFGKGLTEWIIKNREPLLIRKWEDVEKLGVKPYGKPAKSWLGVPLIYRNQVLGVMAVQDYERENAYNETHLAILSAIATEAAIAIENARLYERLKEASYTDPLTGTWNRRRFFEEMKRRIKKGKPFVLVFLDLDNFKYLNDTFGHLYGDKILVDIAKTIKKYVKEAGFISRYGGDEFALVMGYQDEKILRKLIEKIREYVERKGEKWGITVSGGVARYPEDAVELERLIHIADVKLYQAKRRGGNRVVY